MYRHDIGFRIGTTSGVRAGSRREVRNGIDVRLMQERSDKIWIIKTSNSREESLYWEAYYAYKYSIPMYRFVTSDGDNSIPKTALSEKQVITLHRELNTFESGIRLLSDLDMSYEFPHRIPQAEGDRCKINHSWFTTKAINKYGVHNSEVGINTSNQDFIDTFKDLLRITDRSTKTKYNYANGRRTDSNIDEQLELINKIVNRCKDNNIYVEVDTTAKFTENKFMPMTFGNMTVGMLIPIIKEYTEDDIVRYNVVDDEIIEIKRIDYKGYVYDLSVPDIRNFSANGALVHNCIYEWRGSDPSIILTIGAEFNMPTFVLSTNYRCLNEVVDYAATGIKCNNSRYDKSMIAHNKGGTVKIYPSMKEDLCSLSILAMNQIKYWLAHGDKVSDIAVLSRNNFHLAILSNMLLREGIYCNMTEDMKLTKSYMYSDVKDIMSLSETSWKSDLTAKVLWRLCRFMGANNARAFAKFQDSCALSLEDTLGYLLKHFVNKNMTFSKKLKIPMQAEQQMQYQMSKLSKDSIDDMQMLYNTLLITDRVEKTKTLLYQYLNSSSFMYKSKDKNRSVTGLVKYMINLMTKDGYDKMMEFLRVTEQLEGGKMVIPGDKVTLTTIHSAKGREWKNVIMFGCDNVSQPSFDGIYGMIQDDIPVGDIFGHIDEERRLFYVGNTRAKENLFVITYSKPSVFILEALGAFEKGKSGGNDATILELVSDEQWQERYKNIIQEKIYSTDSKYYYNPDDYKI
jgi:DNA helicase-2/ATP-dependent DNA helicase PcrA